MQWCKKTIFILDQPSFFFTEDTKMWMIQLDILRMFVKLQLKK